MSMYLFSIYSETGRLATDITMKKVKILFVADTSKITIHAFTTIKMKICAPTTTILYNIHVCTTQQLRRTYYVQEKREKFLQLNFPYPM